MISFKYLLASLSTFSVLLTPCVLAGGPINSAFPYGSKKVRGVNLGGWLVLEPWITPSLFDNTGNDAIVDEWTFGELQGHNTALAVLQNHWNTWITEQDFADIAAAGLNHVRIPVGYWAFEVGAGEPYISGQLPYLQKAIGWARNYGLKVIIDIHGAPGSQNGFDNSGHRIDFPEWQSNSTNIARTNAVRSTLVATFVNDQDVVTSIQPLNEPAGYYLDLVLTPLRQYYYDSYENTRFPYGNSQQSNTLLLLHDAFQNTSYWSGFMTPPNWQGVALDTHIYQINTLEELSRTYAEHISAACAFGPSLSSFDLWMIVGEWTPAHTDCARYVRGRGLGSRYDGSFAGSTRIGSCSGLTGNASSFSDAFKTFLRQYWEAQTITYEQGQGWLQWTWKAENADEWSYQAGLANGWIPRDPEDRMYPNICD